jgi:hypothetical protein
MRVGTLLKDFDTSSALSGPQPALDIDEGAHLIRVLPDEVEPVAARLRMNEHDGRPDLVEERPGRLHRIRATAREHGFGIGHELGVILVS